MSQLHYNALTPDNAAAAFVLQHACHVYPWSETTFLSCLTPPYSAEQAYLHGQLCGYYVLLMVADEATLMDIGVDAQFRGQGLGRALLTRVLQRCHQAGMQTLWLEVRVSNAAAIELYRSAGFSLIERRKGYYVAEDGKEDALIMCLKLPEASSGG